MSKESARHSPALYVLFRLETLTDFWQWHILKDGACQEAGTAATYEQAQEAVGQIMQQLRGEKT